MKALEPFTMKLCESNFEAIKCTTKRKTFYSFLDKKIPYRYSDAVAITNQRFMAEQYALLLYDSLPKRNC